MSFLKHFFAFTSIVILIVFSFALAFALPSEGLLHNQEQQSKEIQDLLEDEGQIEVKAELKTPIKTINIKAVQEQVFKSMDKENQAEEGATSN